MGYVYHTKMKVGEPYRSAARGGQRVEKRLPENLQKFLSLYPPPHTPIAPSTYENGIYDTHIYSDQPVTEEILREQIPGLIILLFTPSHPAG